MSAAQEQLNQLTQNIEELEILIYRLCKKEEPIDIWDYVMTPRQIAKKIIESSPELLNVPTLEGEQIVEIDPMSVHMVVYGKIMLDENGNLVDNEILYPECVEHDRAMKDDHPMFKEKIKNLKKEVKDAWNQLGIKRDQLKAAYILAGQQIATGAAALVASATVLPLGAGVPAALAAVQTIVGAITDLQYKTLEILPLLGPLLNIPLMIADAAIAIVLGVINLLLNVLIIIIGVITRIKELVAPLILAMGG